MASLAPWSVPLAFLVLAVFLQSCACSLEAIRRPRGDQTVVFAPDPAAEGEQLVHRPVAEVEAELAMVSKPVRTAGAS